ncbi:hypothetical protein FA10DRAFT_259438 [Acaromyces ingoldii]|uniref:RRM domain-containing protein n=1 Tax=Acaromyces ingoldii TaxID=215250 RepID=A0A316YT45_9BASI|nr:hypothetical protein FA10DRAFT_259438 [Acaromyces ingoldii]PWN92206.1 hypothetical protein FA10DRAFT_259438 [Acaromyces ingoldii]
MAPLPPRPPPQRAGIGAGGQVPPQYGGPPPQQQFQSPPNMGGYGGPPPAGGMMMPPNGAPPPPHMMNMGMGAGSPSGPPPPMMMGGGQGQLPAGPMPSSAGGVPAHTTLFIGTISAGVSDMWLHQLLQACGQLRSLKRVNASFGFAEFVDPESVLRALAVLTGQELPPQGAANVDNPAAKKKLTVRADEKTRQFLDKYEQERVQTDSDESMEQTARASVESILAQMADPANSHMAEAKPSYDVPSHLKDLPPEELPEEHRGSVLSEIDKFRQASAAREEEKKRMERIQKMEKMRPAGAGDPGAANGRGDSSMGGPNDKQSYLRPVDFVGASSSQQHYRDEERNLGPDERDEREEARRKEREKEETARAGAESERRYLNHERQRLSHWERELGKERAEEARREKEASHLGKILSEWDQEKEEAQDMFYADRSRWRRMRASLRDRENKADEEDAKLEEEEKEQARIEAERFLERQAKEMAELAEQQRAAGILVPGATTHAPLKLNKIAALDGASNAGPGPGLAAPTTGVLGEAEDEDEEGRKRRSRLAKIELDDDISKQQREDALRQEKRTKLEEGLPSDQNELLALVPKWDHIDELAVERSYRKLLDEGITESVGEPVPDMVDELVKKLRNRPTSRDLVNIIEPVLEEEAPPLVAKLWRIVIADTYSAADGL